MPTCSSAAQKSRWQSAVRHCRDSGISPWCSCGSGIPTKCACWTSVAATENSPKSWADSNPAPSTSAPTAISSRPTSRSPGPVMIIEAVIRFAIRRRWLMLAVVTAFATLGVWSFQHLSIDAVPDITNVQVQINTEAPGFTPLEVEQRVTFVVENAMAGLPRLESTRSVSRYGLSQVTVGFEDGTDIYFARQQIAERLQSLHSRLPAGLEPALGPIATGLGEIFMYTVDAVPGARNRDGSAITPVDLRQAQDWIVRPQLQQVPGVVEINTIGGYEKQFHVLPDPGRMLAHRLTFDDVVTAVLQNNANKGAGYIERNGQQQLIRVPGQIRNGRDLETIVVAQRDGVPIRVGDVATVGIGSELRTGAATQNGR